MSVIEIRYFQDKTVKWIIYGNFGSLMAPKFFQKMVVEDLTKKFKLEADERNRIYESMHTLDWVKI
jgi:hypothetical protein